MIDFLLIRISLGVGFANTFCNNTGIAFGVTSVFAVFALHTSRVFEKFATQSATHDVVKLLRDEFVTVHLMDSFFSLTNGTFSVETEIERSPVLDLFDKAEGKVYLSGGLQCKPGIDRLRRN